MSLLWLPAWVIVWVIAAAGGIAAAQSPNPAIPAASPQATPAKPPSEPVPGVVAIPSPRIPEPQASATKKPKSPHKSSYDITVKSSGWTDTGIDVLAGEQATVTATGEFTLADGRTAGPDGLERGWKDLLRQFPLNSVKTGALIARVTDIGASVPFLIGTGGTITMPTSGRLFLAVNTVSELAGTGEYKVKWKFVPSHAAVSDLVKSTETAATPAASLAVQPAALTTLISPATFAGIPRRVADAQGDPGDMINFALLGTEAQVEAAFKAAGWVPVDKNVGDAIVHGILATLSHEAYTEMPMSTLYLFGRAQDLSFARADPIEVAASRHHLRLWRTDQTVGGLTLWVGSATHDIGFERDRRTPKGITHKIDPDIDLERQFLLQSFDTAGQFSSAAYVTPPDPLREAQTATGGSFHSDGRILVMELK